MEKLSRRDFLRGTAASALGLTVSGILGTIAAAEETGIYKPGTYSATAQGMGTVTVTMTFDANAITDVVIDASGETAGLGDVAAETLSKQILEAQGVVDAVSGATVTSNAVFKAVEACIAQAKGESVIVKDEQANTDWGTFDEKGIFKPNFLVPPTPYEKWDEEVDVDVFVAGLGLAGICATRAAAEAGKKVYAAEQCSSFQVRSGQIGVINSKYQNDMGLSFDEETKQKIVMHQMRANNWRPEQGVWEHWVNHSGEAMDWYLSAVPDAIYLDPKKTPAENGFPDGSYDANDGRTYVCTFNWPMNPNANLDSEIYPMFPDNVVVRPGNVAVCSKIMEALEQDANCSINYKTKVQQLFKDETGRVAGAFVETADGKIVKVNAANGVCLCCGDYGGDPHMRDYYSKESFQIQSWVWTSATDDGQPSNMGMGLKLGAWVGGQVDPGAHTIMTHTFGGSLGCDPFLLVDTHGKRFMNEDVAGNYWSFKILRSPGKKVWQIFDDDYPNQLSNMPTGHSCYWGIVEDEEDMNFGQYIEKIGQTTRKTVEEGTTFICNTLEELAEKMQIPYEDLKATIDRYNEMANAGFDSDFGKRADRLFPIVKAPFYATEVSGVSAFCMVSGLMVDGNCRVLDENNEIIPGLYAAGNNAGNRFAQDYPCITMGISHGFAMTFGKLAGENAAKKLS